MAKSPTKKRREMTEFQITELSSVDRPAQAHAKMTIMKRDGGDLVVHENFIKAWLDPSTGARPFSDFVEASEECNRYYRANDAVSAEINALNDSVRSVVGDNALGTVEKESMLRSSVEDFLASIRSKWPDVETAMKKMLTDEPKPINKGDRDMPDNAEKKISDLEKQVAELTEKLNAATADLTKAGEDLTAAKAATAKAEAEKTDAEFLGKMDAKQRAFYEAMSDDDKAKAKKGTMADLDKAIAKAAEGDEVLKIDGNEIRKSVVGESQFAALKALAKKNDDLAKQASDANETLQKANFEKAADETVKHLPGTTVEKGAVLKAINDLPEAVKKTLDTMLKAGEAAIVSAFKSVGHQGGEIEKAAGAFQKKVDDIAARDGITKTAAMQKARAEFPEEFKAYQEAGRAAN